MSSNLTASARYPQTPTLRRGFVFSIRMKPKPKKRSPNETQITLGDGWRQFGFEREDLEFLGVIRRGMEIGALAKDATGAYLQVNGDMRQVLNKSRVETYMRSAPVRISKVVMARQPSEAERAAVVVVVKPRRRIILPPT